MTAQARSATTTVPLATTPPDRPTAPVPPLLRLPLELHHLVAAQLSLPGYLALRLTHPYLYNALAAPVPAPSLRSLDSCARLAVRTYLSPYFSGCPGNLQQTFFQQEKKKPSKNASMTLAQGKAKRQPTNTSAHCLLCAAPYAPRLFKSTSSPAVEAKDLGAPVTTYPDLSSATKTWPTSSLPRPTTGVPPAVEQGRQRLARSHPDWDVLSLPDGVCAWHASRFARVVYEWPAGLPCPEAALTSSSRDAGTAEAQEASEAEQLRRWSWFAFTSTLCPHCGAVAAFRACTCCSTRASATITSAPDRCVTPDSAITSSPRAAGAQARTHAIDHGVLATTAAPQQRQRCGVCTENATTATSSAADTNTAAATTTHCSAAAAVTPSNVITSTDDNGSKASCQTCALRPVTVYVRHLPSNDNAQSSPGQSHSWNVSSFRFWRDADDRLWVREEGFVSPGAETKDSGDDGFGSGSWRWGADMWMWAWGRGADWAGGKERDIRKDTRRMRRGAGGVRRVVDVPVRWVGL